MIVNNIQLNKFVELTLTLAAMREAESGNDAGKVKLDSIESFVASMSC